MGSALSTLAALAPHAASVVSRVSKRYELLARPSMLLTYFDSLTSCPAIILDFGASGYRCVVAHRGCKA